MPRSPGPWWNQSNKKEYQTAVFRWPEWCTSTPHLMSPRQWGELQRYSLRPGQVLSRVLVRAESQHDDVSHRKVKNRKCGYMERIDLRQTGQIMFFFSHWSIHLMWKLWMHRNRLQKLDKWGVYLVVAIYNIRELFPGVTCQTNLQLL